VSKILIDMGKILLIGDLDYLKNSLGQLVAVLWVRRRFVDTAPIIYPVAAEMLVFW
jgi:hypothetical protein